MQEAQIEAILQEAQIDLLVLARYMQIFSEDFCSRHAQHTINIHHSFLPAFEGTLQPVIGPCKDHCVDPSCCSCELDALKSKLWHTFAQLGSCVEGWGCVT